MTWETVIGLEIHVQLQTKSKIFSGASTAYGAEANTQACDVSIALPGVLPVMNTEAAKLPVEVRALHADPTGEVANASVYINQLPRKVHTLELRSRLTQRQMQRQTEQIPFCTGFRTSVGRVLQCRIDDFD